MKKTKNSVTKKVTFKLENLKRKRIKIKRKNHESLNFLVANANGITGKIDSLTAALKEQETSIALISETKLDSKEAPYVDGYKWIPRNRKNKQGGGVAIIYNTKLDNRIKPVEVIENEDLETQWAELNNGKSKIFIGIFYGPQERAPK